ncbi:DEAD/DEAH box helicase [Longispora fulva]
MRGGDVIGQAPTGTGKTLGFGIPILERTLDVSEGADGAPQALIVVPTRELNVQVARDLAAAGKVRGIRVLAVYGGVAYEPQVDALAKGVDIVVGTPGRLMDLAKQKKLDLGKVRTLVLDEADRMLDLGFLEDVTKILAMLPEQRQTMLFSATMPDPIVALSRRFLKNPVTIHAGHNDNSAPNPLTKQFVYRTHPMNKAEVVARILQAKDRGLTMIFCRTKRATQNLAEDLDFRGFAAGAVHGDLGQGARERALRAFRAGKVDVLVATDVAARGIDVTAVTHVINYDCPEDQETYVHRIGRTGRAGATGVAVTFVDWEDAPRWSLIDKNLHLDQPNPPETYHTSPHLLTDLDIPEGVTGTLPSAQRTRSGLSSEAIEDIEGGPRKGGRDRDRGDRKAGGRGGRSERPAAPTEVAADKPPRQRRRSRRVAEGESVVASEGQTSASDVSLGSASDVDLDSAPVSASVSSKSATRSRSRTRSGSVSERSGSVSDSAPVAAESVALDSVTSESAASGSTESGSSAPRARRSRSSAPAPAVALGTPFASGVVAPVFAAPVLDSAQDDVDGSFDDGSDAARKPRRRRRRPATSSAE